jgi:TonB family protein
VIAALVLASLASGARAQGRIAPSLLDGPAPELPAERDERDATIVLSVVVAEDGGVIEAEPVTPSDAELDRLAVEAVRGWRFAPGVRDGVAVTARVRVEVRFRAAPIESAPSPDPPPPVATEGDVAPTYSATGSLDPIAESAGPRSPSDVVLSGDQVRAAPRRDAIDVLSAVPGVWVARVHGDGGAPAISIRGSDADHGQDLELSVGGVPLNEPSNVHGQGYTDLNWLLPEILSSVHVTEGVHDPHQGDFAIAGSIDLRLGSARRGLFSRTSYGSFDTFRQALIWAPPREREGTFVAASYRVTRGYGVDRSGQQAALVAQSELAPSPNVRVRLLGIVHASRYALPQIVRWADVDSGAIPFDGGYADPAAAFPLIASVRARAAGTVDVDLGRGSFVEGMLWLGYGNLVVRGNYTGYAGVSGDPDPDVRARGDRFQQRDEGVDVGLGGRWHGERLALADWLSALLEVGARGRFVSRRMQHGLASAVDEVVTRASVDADARIFDLGAFVDLDVCLSDVVRLRGGARAEMFVMDVDDRIGGAHVTPVGGFVGPRVSLEVQAMHGPSGDLVLAASYGEGLRSPPAVVAARTNDVPIARVRTGDVGLRFSAGGDEHLSLTLSGFVAALSSELLFTADGGGLEPVGPSTRIGAATTLVTHPLPWLRASLAATWVRATLDAPEPSTPGEPAAYRAGDPLPFLAPLTVRAEAGIDEAIARPGDRALRLRVRTGFTFLSPRPLPYQDVARAVGLLDVGAGLAWGPLELDVDVFNALDQRFAAQEYAMPIAWTPSATEVTTPSRALTAGYPVTVLATLGIAVP